MLFENSLAKHEIKKRKLTHGQDMSIRLCRLDVVLIELLGRNSESLAERSVPRTCTRCLALVPGSVKHFDSWQSIVERRNLCSREGLLGLISKL
jgi:hypothetical protein